MDATLGSSKEHLLQDYVEDQEPSISNTRGRAKWLSSPCYLIFGFFVILISLAINAYLIFANRALAGSEYMGRSTFSRLMCMEHSKEHTDGYN